MAPHSSQTPGASLGLLTLHCAQLQGSLQAQPQPAACEHAVSMSFCSGNHLSRPPHPRTPMDSNSPLVSELGWTLRLTSNVTSSGKPTLTAQNWAIIIACGCPPPRAQSLPVAALGNLNRFVYFHVMYLTIFSYLYVNLGYIYMVCILLCLIYDMFSKSII